MTRLKLFALLIIVSLISLVGCGGGGGGGSAPLAFEKAITGITATLDKFATALRAGDISSSGLLSGTTDSAQATKILYVYDFGVDLSSSADNQKWEFVVNPADINQTAPNVAIVRASKVMSTGTTLWLVFNMVKDQGLWMIEGIEVEESVTAKSFITKIYYPVIPGASMTYLIPGASPYFYTNSISEAGSVQMNGIVFYKENDFYPSIRPARRAQIFDNKESYVGYNSLGELWGYSPSINNAQPYRIMKAAYAIGDKEVIREVSEKEIIITTLTLASQSQLVTTPLRTFQTVAMLEQWNYSYEGKTATETSIVYFADGVGVVKIENFDVARPEAQSTELLFERYVNGVYDRNLPVITSLNNSQNIVAGNSMVPVQFTSTGGSVPFTWTIENAPAGVTIESTKGLLQGRPVPELTTWYITVTATDVYGRRGFKQYDLAVVSVPPLTVTVKSTSQRVVVGKAMTPVTFSATGNTGNIAWYLDENPLSLSIDQSSGVLSGTVNARTALGDYAVTVRATDSIGGTGTMNFIISVINPPALTLISSDGSNGQTVVAGQAMTDVTFSVNGSPRDITWSVTGNPSNLGIGSTGMLSGYVDATILPGDHVMLVRATNAAGETGTFSYTVKVVPGTYCMADFYPIVSGDEYHYAILGPDDTVVPVRMHSSLSKTENLIAVSGGETVRFFEQVFTYPDISGDLVTNLRMSAKPMLRRSLRAAEGGPNILYYRGVDAAGNIWEQCSDANNGEPYKILNAWTNPGETSRFDMIFDDGFIYNYSVQIGSALISSMVTPLKTYSNVMKITYLAVTTAPDGTKDTLNFVEYCVEGVGIVATYYYDDPALSIISNKELVLETILNGGTTLTANDPVISISDKTVTSNFSFALEAEGGSREFPYTWSVKPLYVDTQMRFQNGTTYFEGYLAPETYSFTLKVIDHYYRSATKLIALTVK